MAHYWLAAEQEPARRAQLEDWVEDLADFGPAIVADACREWRRTQPDRRPGPGHIRALCLAAQREQRERAHHRALASPDAMDAYARSVGFANNAERMEQIRKDDSKHNDPANFERLRQIEQALTMRRAGKLRPTGRIIREATAEELRQARIALKLEPEPPQPMTPAQAAE